MTNQEERAGAIMQELGDIVLYALVTESQDFGLTFTYFNFSTLTDETSLPRDIVRAVARWLTDCGLAQYKSGLFNDDGMAWGSGYAATDAGVARARQKGWID